MNLCFLFIFIFMYFCFCFILCALHAFFGKLSKIYHIKRQSVREIKPIVPLLPSIYTRKPICRTSSTMKLFRGDMCPYKTTQPPPLCKHPFLSLASVPIIPVSFSIYSQEIYIQCMPSYHTVLLVNRGCSGQQKLGV